jgi:hypothetical protein
MKFGMDGCSEYAADNLLLLKNINEETKQTTARINHS